MMAQQSQNGVQYDDFAHVMPMALSMEALHSLCPEYQNEVQHDIFGHVV